MERRQPNVLVTGTPGVGKSTFSRRLDRKTVLEWLEISKFASENECTTGEPDPVYQSAILDENKLLDLLEEKLKLGGYIIDHHSSDIFPVRWFDFVVVLVVGNTVLYDRLTARGYTGKKLEDNIDCEIFQTILEDVRESFHNGIIHVFRNITHEELRRNVNSMVALIEEWIHTAADTSSDTSASTTSPDSPQSPAPLAFDIIPNERFDLVNHHKMKFQNTAESDVAVEYVSETDNAVGYGSETDNAPEDIMVPDLVAVPDESIDLVHEAVEHVSETDNATVDITVPDVVAENVPGPEKVVADLPGSEKVVADLPGSEKVVADLQGSEKVVADLPGSEKVVADLPGSEKMVADLSGSEKGTADLPELDKVLADLSGPEKVVTDLSGPEKMVTDLSKPEKVVADLPEPDESAVFTPEPEMARPYTPEEEIVAPETPEPEMQE